MNGTRRAELEEAEGLPGFMALNYLSFFIGFLGSPGSGMRIYRLHWEPHLVGALSSQCPPWADLSAVSWEALSA